MPICWTKSSVKCVRSPEILNLCHSSYNWMNYPEQNIQSKLNIHERQIDDGILRMRRGNKLVMLTGEPRVGSGEPPIHRSLQRTKAAPEPLLPSLETAASRLEEHVTPLIPPLGAATHRLPPGNRSRRSRDAVHERSAGGGWERRRTSGCQRLAANELQYHRRKPPKSQRRRRRRQPLARERERKWQQAVGPLVCVGPAGGLTDRAWAWVRVGRLAGWVRAGWLVGLV